MKRWNLTLHLDDGTTMSADHVREDVAADVLHALVHQRTADAAWMLAAGADAFQCFETHPSGA